MAALHSLLALYGAFDQSVVEANDPDWTARVKRFLPATTGVSQRGWFSELKNLVNRLASDATAAQFPGVAEAVAELTAVANAISGEATARPSPADSAAFDEPAPPTSGSPVLTTTDIAQVLYIFAVGNKLEPYAPQTSVDFSAFTDAGNLDAIIGLAGEPPTTIYGRGAFTGPRSESQRNDQIAGLRGFIQSQFKSHRSWKAAMTGALRGDYVTVEVATAPIPLAGIATGAVSDNKGSSATAAVTLIDGTYCAVLTTDSWQQSDPDLTVDAVKKIVDPRNWAALSPFFCQMDALAPDPNGASQVLEHVSTDKDSYQLKTALKNWKEDFEDGGILNYELADKRTGTGDSGLVLVDNGYIHITQNKLDDGSTKGVRIRTSKIVAIEGSSVTAIAIFALGLGWAAVGNAMLFDNALHPPKSLPDGSPLHGWSTSPEPSPGAPGTGAASGQAPSPPPQMPAGAGAALVKEAVRMWARCVEDTTKTTSEIMNKWYKGELTVADMVTYSSQLGGRLASEPWRYLQDISNRSAATTPSQGATQNTNKGGSS